VIIYVGALGGWYLTDKLVTFLSVAHEADSTALPVILTQSAQGPITEKLEQCGISAYRVLSVPPAEVPDYLKAADLAVSFIKECYSKLASSPTKVAEYLAAGLPVICNAGIGDLDEVIGRDRVGVIVRDLDEDGYRRALEQLEDLRESSGLAERCTASAARRFDLEHVGAARYARLYRRLLAEEHEPAVCASTAK
jgi:glycosyltransferase involved in cell wall biosynthesis